MVKIQKTSFFLLAISCLSACRFEVSQKKVIKKGNLIFNSLNKIDLRHYKVHKNSIDEIGIGLMEEKYYEHGFQIYKEDINSKFMGIQSLYNSKFSPAKYVDISFIKSELLSDYAVLVDENNNVDIFDFALNFVMGNLSSGASIKLSQEIVETEYREEKLLERWEIDGEEKIFLMDKNGNRSSSIPFNLLLRTNNGGYYPTSYSLYDIGLKHKASVSSDGIFECNGAKFLVPDSSFSSFSWKSLLVQDYDENTIKSYRYDLLTGEKHSFDFDYKIVGSRHIYNENGEAKYLLVDASDDTNDNFRFIINNKFEIIYDCTEDYLYSNDLEALTKYVFYSPSNKIIFDYKGDEMFKIQDDVIGYSYNVNQFVCKKTDGNLYLLDYKNEFKYDIKDLKDVNIKYVSYTKGIGYDNYGSPYIVDASNGNVEKMNISDVFYDTGIGVTACESNGDVSFIGYGGEVAASYNGSKIYRVLNNENFIGKHSIFILEKTDFKIAITCNLMEIQ